jgi:membrane protein
MPNIFLSVNRRVLRIRDRVLGYSWIKFIMRVFAQMGFDNGSNLAAAMSYYAFLSIFPLLLALIGGMSLLIPADTLKTQLFSFISNNVPGLLDLVQTNIDNILRVRGSLSVAGIILLLVSGSQVVAAASNAINLAWDIANEIPFYLKKPRDLGITISLGALFLIYMSAGIIFSLTRVSDVPILGSVLVQVGVRTISALLSFIIFLLLFKIVPNTRTFWKHIWFGALVTAVLFELGRGIAFYYLTNFTDYSLIYGSITSAIILLLWLYYSALIVIIGAEFTAEYGRTRLGISRTVAPTRVTTTANQ